MQPKSSFYKSKKSKEIKIKFLTTYDNSKSTHCEDDLQLPIIKSKTINISPKKLNSSKNLKFSFFDKTKRNLSIKTMDSNNRKHSRDAKLPGNRFVTETNTHRNEYKNDKIEDIISYTESNENDDQSRLLKTQKFKISKPLLTSNSTTEHRHPTKRIYSDMQITKYKSINLLSNSSYFSNPGANDDGTTKVNQDRYLIMENIFNIDYKIYGIMDGHGSLGEKVSEYVKKEAKSYFSNKDNYKLSNQSNDKAKSKSIITSSAIIQDILTNSDCSFIKNFYTKVDKELPSSIDVTDSGTTCNMIFIIGNKLICSNTGDSRSILIKRSTLTNVLDFINLSTDHVPTLPKEKERIIKCGGTVERDKNGIELNEGPFRVWKLGEDYPGLAISRSIGDTTSKECGVICDCEITINFIRHQYDVCIVSGSDGLWDYLSGNDIIDIIGPFIRRRDSKGAAEEVVKVASKKWSEGGLDRDDITCIVAFF